MAFESRRRVLLDRVDRAFKASVLDVQLEAMGNAPVRTGDLRRRIHISWLGRGHALVGTDHPGGKLREFGGTIVAKRARFLHFKTRDGHWVKVRQVTQRPGGYSQGFKPWLRPAGAHFAAHMTRHLRER